MEKFSEVISVPRVPHNEIEDDPSHQTLKYMENNCFLACCMKSIFPKSQNRSDPRSDDCYSNMKGDKY